MIGLNSDVNPLTTSGDSGGISGSWLEEENEYTLVLLVESTGIETYADLAGDLGGVSTDVELSFFGDFGGVSLASITADVEGDFWSAGISAEITSSLVLEITTMMCLSSSIWTGFTGESNFGGLCWSDLSLLVQRITSGEKLTLERGDKAAAGGGELTGLGLKEIKTAWKPSLNKA